MTNQPLPLIGETPTLVRDAAPDDLRMWSVTTIIGVLEKAALAPWAALKTAEAAVDDHDVWQSRLEHEGRDAAIQYLKNARFRGERGQRSATELGTAVHKALEHKLINKTFAERDRTDLELRPFLLQLNQFLKDFGPKFLAAEVTVFNETYGYAGTADGFLELDGVTYIFDMKTTREPYDRRGKPKTPFPEVALQLAAYRHAELAAVWRARQSEQFKRRFYLLNDTERALAKPVIVADHGLVLQVTPESYSLHPVRCDAEIFDLFLAVLDAARFPFELAKSVVGNPLIPPTAFQHATDDPFVGLPPS